MNNKKVIRSWIFYDWANSVYALVISTAIFPLYYASLTSNKVNGVLHDTVYFLGIPFKNTEFMSYTMSFSYILVAILSPLLSGIADYTGNKLLFLKTFCYLGALSCAGLFFFNMQYFELSMILVLLASVGYWASLVFYNSYLPDIVTPDRYDSVSAQGFAMGYLGSNILLIINLVMILVLEMNPKWCFLLVAIWWIGFAQISYRFLPKRLPPKESSIHKLYRGFYELKKVFLETKNLPSLRQYLRSFFIFSMGVQTVMVMAVYFGEKEIQWSSNEEKTSGLIISILIIQFIAVGGSYLHSFISKNIGNKKTLMFSLVCWIAICIYAYSIFKPWQFYTVAALVGVVMGGIQSISRSSYSKLLPNTPDTTSYFSFYDVTEKIALVFGAFSFGFLERITGSMRVSVILISTFFVLGLILLFFVSFFSFTSKVYDK